MLTGCLVFAGHILGITSFNPQNFPAIQGLFLQFMDVKGRLREAWGHSLGLTAIGCPGFEPRSVELKSSVLSSLLHESFPEKSHLCSALLDTVQKKQPRRFSLEEQKWRMGRLEF